MWLCGQTAGAGPSAFWRTTLSSCSWMCTLMIKAGSGNTSGRSYTPAGMPDRHFSYSSRIHRPFSSLAWTTHSREISSLYSLQLGWPSIRGGTFGHRCVGTPGCRVSGIILKLRSSQFCRPQCPYWAGSPIWSIPWSLKGTELLCFGNCRWLRTWRRKLRKLSIHEVHREL